MKKKPATYSRQFWNNKTPYKWNMKKINDWLKRGDGGEWYEPYVTNEDCVYIGIITTIVCGMLILGGLIVNNYS
jgi:hypothetical protein